MMSDRITLSCAAAAQMKYVTLSIRGLGLFFTTHMSIEHTAHACAVCGRGARCIHTTAEQARACWVCMPAREWRQWTHHHSGADPCWVGVVPRRAVLHSTTVQLVFRTRQTATAEFAAVVCCVVHQHWHNAMDEGVGLGRGRRLLCRGSVRGIQSSRFWHGCVDAELMLIPNTSMQYLYVVRAPLRIHKTVHARQSST